MDSNQSAHLNHHIPTQRVEGESERKEERISEMSILCCEQRHLFMQNSSACIVVKRQAAVKTSSGRTEEFRCLQEVSFAKIRKYHLFALLKVCSGFTLCLQLYNE